MYKVVVVAGTLAMSLATFGNELAGYVMQDPETKAEPAHVVAVATPAGPRVVALAADARGQFVTDIQAEGHFLRVLVDTGATTVALSAEDARTLGIRLSPGDFTVPVSTANGISHAAKVRLHEVRLQSLVLRDVDAMVMPVGALHHSLLGMSFIRRLGSVEMQGKTLVLRQ